MGVQEEFDTNMLQDLLPLYYKRMFPTNLMYRWLSYGEDYYFARREFSFTLAGDIYIRFQSFNNESEFAAQLEKKNPEKIDIGAVYNQRPKSRGTDGTFQPESKEFVLDIDLTDYDDVRTCCSGAKVCSKCWKYLGVAVEILDSALRQDFGFKDLLWVYSGRRGVHCWVCDEVARNLDTLGRSAIAEYLQVIRGGDNKAKKVKLGDHFHPSIRRAVKVVDEHFEEICKDDQAVFDDDKHLAMLPEDVRNKVQKFKGEERWNEIMKQLEEKYEKRKIKISNFYLNEVQLQLCYPRLDIHVSKGLNHLLKSPFVIHPKTGQVCVPFDPKKVYSFVTTDVPTITRLLDEIAAYDKENVNAANVKAWKKTSLAPYMRIFEMFVKSLEKNQQQLKHKMEF